MLTRCMGLSLHSWSELEIGTDTITVSASLCLLVSRKSTDAFYFYESKVFIKSVYTRECVQDLQFTFL